MKKLVKTITINETFEFKGNYIDLKSLLDNTNKKFYLEWLSRKEIKIKSKWSVGTFSGFFSGINGYITIQNTHTSPLKLQLKTKIKPEVIFITVISLILIIAVSLSNEDIPTWFFLLLPFAVLWNWFVYRIQEKMLFSKFKNLIS
jgi:hypothetical protein